MATRRAVSFPHAEEGGVLLNNAEQHGDDEDERAERGMTNKRLAAGGFRQCAACGLVALVFILLFTTFGPKEQLFGGLSLPDPLAEQAKINSDVKAHEYTVVRKAAHDSRAGAEPAVATLRAEPPKTEIEGGLAQAEKAKKLEQQQQQPKTQKALPLKASASGVDLEALRNKAVENVAAVRAMKQRGIVMETDSEAKVLIAKTQDALRALLRKEYGGDGPYYVQMDLTFPASMPDFEKNGPSGSITIEMAPIALVPYVVYYFLEMVKNFKSGAFHRNAGHVLQAMYYLQDGAERGGLAWQEYDPGFPHKKYTMGYAGRPGGPAFYISTVDNTDNHGPASQGSKTEADGCFGRVVRGRDVVKRMMKQPGKSKPNGFVDDSKHFIRITSLRILPKGTKVQFDPADMK